MGGKEGGGEEGRRGEGRREGGTATTVATDPGKLVAEQQHDFVEGQFPHLWELEEATVAGEGREGKGAVKNRMVPNCTYVYCTMHCSC